MRLAALTGKTSRHINHKNRHEGLNPTEPNVRAASRSYQFAHVQMQKKCTVRHNEKSDKVAAQLKARGDLIGLRFDWLNFIRDWFRFRID